MLPALYRPGVWDDGGRVEAETEDGGGGVSQAPEKHAAASNVAELVCAPHVGDPSAAASADDLAELAAAEEEAGEEAVTADPENVTSGIGSTDVELNAGDISVDAAVTVIAVTGGGKKKKLKQSETVGCGRRGKRVPECLAWKKILKPKRETRENGGKGKEKEKRKKKGEGRKLAGKVLRAGEKKTRRRGKIKRLVKV